MRCQFLIYLRLNFFANINFHCKNKQKRIKDVLINFLIKEYSPGIELMGCEWIWVISVVIKRTTQNVDNALNRQANNEVINRCCDNKT